MPRDACDMRMCLKKAGLNRTLDEWLCDSFKELIEEMELWKWDDATRDFWSRLQSWMTIKKTEISAQHEFLKPIYLRVHRGIVLIYLDVHQKC